MQDLEADAGTKRKRNRQHLNCAECRRLKLKCDRQIPCAHCVKRECQDLCPEGARSTFKRGSHEEIRDLQHNLRALQDTLDKHGIPVPDTGTMHSGPSAVLPSVPQMPSISTAAASQQAVPLEQMALSAPGITGLPVNELEPLSHGTLVLMRDGRSKYLGPSAASEWLKDQEIQDSRENSPYTRPPSPENGEPKSTFPFTEAAASPSTAFLLNALPAEDEAQSLIAAYQRYFGWSYDLAPRQLLQQTLDDVYRQRRAGPPYRVPLQSLALLFIVLAMGTLHNLEALPNDPIGDEYLSRARDCLVKDNFLIKSTIAGVRTLNVMAHYHLETDRGRNGDAAWPIWGLAMRIIQAMGLHRDGSKWGLDADVVDDRRRIFWETHSAEVFQANCFSRPCSITREFVDTLFPVVPEKDYCTLKFELCQMAEEILRGALQVHRSPFNERLHDQLIAFEKSVPYAHRCRTALVVIPSIYPDREAAIRDSPEVNRRDLKRTFEQHSLALMISEALINLNRPYFLRALTERPDDPTASTYARQFLTVVERSNVIIQIACTMWNLHPTVTARHWWIWYHAFNSAICMGTLILISPHTDLSTIALNMIDQVREIYTALVQTRTSPRCVQNLRWILRLRERAASRMASTQQQQQSRSQPVSRDEGDPEIDAGLLGWKTRFIERAKGSQTARTIPTTSPQSNLNLTPSHDVDDLIRGMPLALQQHVAPDQTWQDLMMQHSTDDLLHQYWDPINLSTEPTDTNGLLGQEWWNMFFNDIPHT